MADPIYNTAQWKRLRALHLALHPLCESCSAKGLAVVATHVDHRVPISAGGNPFPSHDGLASLCVSCHSQKTARGVEAGAVRTTRKVQPRKGCDANGNAFDPSHPWNEKSLRAAALDTAVPLPTQLVPKRPDHG